MLFLVPTWMSSVLSRLFCVCLTLQSLQSLLASPKVSVPPSQATPTGLVWSQCEGTQSDAGTRDFQTGTTGHVEGDGLLGRWQAGSWDVGNVEPGVMFFRRSQPFKMEISSHSYSLRAVNVHNSLPQRAVKACFLDRFKAGLNTSLVCNMLPLWLERWNWGHQLWCY